jgi:hypothetical protein
MLEIGVLSIVVLAVGYWVTLWLMGRHDDVLHGDFVHHEPGADAAVTSVFPAKPLPKPPLSAKPFPEKSFPEKPAAIKPVTAKSAAANPVPAKSVKPLPAQPLLTSLPRSERLDTLQSLLASIKRDLKDASQL